MVNHQHRVRERKEDICRKRRKWPISAATQNSKPKWKACKMKRVLQIVIQMRQTAGGRCAPVNFAKPISFEAAGPPFEHVSPVKSTRRQRYLINMISFPCPEHCSSYQLELQMRGVCACLRSIPAATFFSRLQKTWIYYECCPVSILIHRGCHEFRISTVWNVKFFTQVHKYLSWSFIVGPTGYRPFKVFPPPSSLFLTFQCDLSLPPLYLRMFSTCSSYIWTTSVVVYYHITVFVFRCLPIFALPIFVLPKFVPSYICVPINGSSCNWFFLGPFLPIKWVDTSHGKYMIIDHKPNQCQLHVFFFCTIFFSQNLFTAIKSSRNVLHPSSLI